MNEVVQVKTIEEIYNEIQLLIQEFNTAHDKFVNQGIKSHGTKARVATTKMAKLMKSYRDQSIVFEKILAANKAAARKAE
ncbi:hypothetical protein AGMMS50239_26040 [Bacteroidia bacterium]|nr:hypothetical protein AGMMS50239_26040 [Bacteroidia bacterium]